MKKTFLFLTALAMSAMMMAETATSTFTDKNWNVGEDEEAWTATGAATQAFESADPSRGVQITLKNIKNDGLTLTNSSIKDLGGISKVELVYSCNTDKASAGTIAVAVGSTAFGEAYTIVKENNAAISFENETPVVDDIVITFTSTQTTKSVYVKSITVTYGSASTVTLDSLYIKGKATKMEYEVGETFNTDGLEVWGYYTKVMKHDSTSQIKSGFEWSIDPETFAEVSDNESVTLSASYKLLRTADTTITGINVTEPAPLSKYAYIYSSNVEFTDEGGTKATLSQVVVAEGDTVKAIKCGTGSVDGSCVITIPAATKTLHFHAVAWTGKPTTMDVNGTIYNLVADAGIFGNSTTYTLVGEPSDYYFSFDPKGATAITFTAKSDHRFVLYGVNAELEEGVIAAPAFTPTDTDFDGSVEVTLTCETEGAEIFYAIGEEVTSMNAQQYTEPIKLTATTTIYAVAKKDGKESAPVNKTYNLVPAYTLAELAAITPTGQKAILVLDDDEIVEIYAKKETGEVSGIYFQVGEKKIELYNQSYAFPKTWEVAGTVSGRVMGEWVDWEGQWELKIATEEIGKLTYTAPGEPTGLQDVMMKSNIRKAMHNGRIMILKGDKLFNLQGMLVK